MNWIPEIMSLVVVTLLKEAVTRSATGAYFASGASSKGGTAGLGDGMDLASMTPEMIARRNALIRYGVLKNFFRRSCLAGAAGALSCTYESTTGQISEDQAVDMVLRYINLLYRGRGLQFTITNGWIRAGYGVPYDQQYYNTYYGTPNAVNYQYYGQYPQAGGAACGFNNTGRYDQYGRCMSTV